MSKLLEWAKLAIKGLPHLDDIVSGVINDVKFQHGNLPEDQQEEIARRRLICRTCPLNSFNAKTSQEYFDLYGKHYKSDRNDLHCSICSCNISLKTASLESDCGITSYNQNNLDKQIPLKWEKYESR